MNIQDVGGVPQDRRAGRGGAAGDAAGREPLPPRADPRFGADPGARVRWGRREQRRHGEPGPGTRSDLLVRHGGRPVLSETPEIYGGEHLLTGRAVNCQVAEKLMERVRWWEDLCPEVRREHRQQPLGREQEGGPDDDLREVLGAIAKGGTARSARSTSTGSRSARRASSSWTPPVTTLRR